jgi:hypothetical protein
MGFKLKLREDRPATIEEHRALRSEIARLRAGLFSAADQLDTIAFDMPPPNSYTPRFAMLANSIRQFVHEQDVNPK